MPKRPNPFGDSSPLQFKTHIGVKELATGSRHDELMKDVYDKTRERLFTGAQRSIDINDNHMQSMAPPPQSQSALDASSRFEPMQMLLDGTGYLVSPIPLASSTATKQCAEFSGWVDCGNAAASLRNQTPVTSVPGVSGQMRLDSNGYLTAPLHDDAMDCDADSDVQMTNCAAVARTGPTTSGSGAVGGLQRFGFKSTRQPSQKAGGGKALCETCRRIPGGLRCQFCERAVCQGCVRECDSCSDHFCQLCSTLNYDAATERAFCLSCAG